MRRSSTSWRDGGEPDGATGLLCPKQNKTVYVAPLNKSIQIGTILTAAHHWSTNDGGSGTCIVPLYMYTVAAVL